MIREPWPGYSDEVARAIERERVDERYSLTLSNARELYQLFAGMTFSGSVVVAILALALTHSL